jgi:chromosome partitioning protein
MLGDIDRQQSTRTWLRQRNAAPSAERPEIKAWAVDPRFFARPPSSADHVVLDTPGGLTGLDLRELMYADAILMPVCNSLFDRESARCLAELRTLPRVARALQAGASACGWARALKPGRAGGPPISAFQ